MGKGLAINTMIALAAFGLVSSAAATVIFDNITPNGGPAFGSGALQASQLDRGFGFDAGCADDFVLPTSGAPSGDWNVTNLHWFGRFVTGNPAPINTFNIIFWPDAGGLPAGSNAAGLPPKYTQALAIYNDVPATSAPGGGGDRSFQYDATLPTPFTAQDGVVYWVEIQANINYPPLWSFEVTNTTQFSRPPYGYDLFNTPFWSDIGAQEDNAFTLGGEPVPEPATLILVGSCLVLAARRRK